MACYSPGMETKNAPDLTEGYPSRGTKIGPAWSEAWSVLTRYPGEWREGQELWLEIAPKHGLRPDTLRALMFRMAQAGHLESKSVQVITSKGKRNRTQFRYVSKGE